MLFSFWNFLYLLLVAAAGILISLGLRGKSIMAREKTLNRISALLLGVYLLELLTALLLTGGIRLTGLLFQTCALAAVLVFLTRYVKLLARFRAPVMLTGLAASVLYLVFPEGDAPEGVPAAVFAAQSLIGCGLLAVYGLVSISTGSIRISVKNLPGVLILATGIAAWKMVGETLWAAGSYGVRTAGISEVRPWAAFVGMILVFTTVAAAICAVALLCPRLKREKKEEKATIYIADRRAV